MCAKSNPNIISSKHGKVYVFGNRKLEPQSEVTLRIVRLAKFISIGLCEHTDAQFSEFTTQKRILYWDEGSFFDGHSEHMKISYGFDEGDLVTMEVDRHAGRVCWFVGSNMVYSFQTAMVT